MAGFWKKAAIFLSDFLSSFLAMKSLSRERPGFYIGHFVVLQADDFNDTVRCQFYIRSEFAIVHIICFRGVAAYHDACALAVISDAFFACP